EGFFSSFLSSHEKKVILREKINSIVYFIICDTSY
ncbi:MAG: hypothetical protein ACJA1A_003672, partial [Saprospiraceae bacterium]